MLEIIKTFKIALYNAIKKINKYINSRSDSTISFRDIIYYSSLHVGNNESFETINVKLQINDIINVSTNTIKKRKNNISYTYFEMLNNDLLKHIYNHNDEQRIIGIDGTYITLLKILEKGDFSTNKTDDYCTAMLSTIFDTEKQMPINYYLM